MASVAQASPSGSAQQKLGLSRLYSIRTIDWWWLAIPRRLLRYSTSLAATWTDGIYLTAWPRLAVALPFALLVFGFLEGATHFSFFTVGDGALSSTEPAIAFAQNLILVFLAAAVGSLSANLGMALVLGFAIGDYLFAGPQMQTSGISPWLSFLEFHVPQLISYLLFFLLAALPTMISNLFLADLRRRGKVFASAAFQAPCRAIFQAAIVFLWVMMTPIVIRTFWIYAGQGSSQVTVPYYRELMVPWLLVVAGVFALVRGVLETMGQPNPQVQDRVDALRIFQLGTGAPVLSFDQKPWVGAIVLACITTLLWSGYFLTLIPAAITLVLLTGIMVTRASILPHIPAWNGWMRLLDRIPLALRGIVACLATYLIARSIVAVTGLNTTAGAFGAQISASLLGLILMIVLCPLEPASLSSDAMTDLPATLGSLPVAWRRVGMLGLWLVILFLVPQHLHASCVEPTCCFGDPGNGGWSPIGPPWFTNAMGYAWAAATHALGGDQQNDNGGSSRAVAGVRG